MDFAKLLSYILHPRKFVFYFLERYPGLIKDDRKYLEAKWKASEMIYPLNLDDPRSFNEKLQWLKLYYRKPEFVQMVDKVEVKRYAEQIIGSEHIIPTYGVWDNAEDIDFDSLPEKFVIKCNHSSGGFCLCKDKSKLNVEQVRKMLSKGLKNDYSSHEREWQYKAIRRKVLAEKMLTNPDGSICSDYKWFCFNGDPKILLITEDRGKENDEVKNNYFDINMNLLPFTQGHPNSKKIPSKPKTFDEQVAIAKKLSKGYPFMRVDLYECDGIVYLGELTLYHWSGRKMFEPSNWDLNLGAWINLPPKYNE